MLKFAAKLVKRPSRAVVRLRSPSGPTAASALAMRCARKDAHASSDEAAVDFGDSDGRAVAFGGSISVTDRSKRCCNARRKRGDHNRLTRRVRSSPSMKKRGEGKRTFKHKKCARNVIGEQHTTRHARERVPEGINNPRAWPCFGPNGLIAVGGHSSALHPEIGVTDRCIEAWLAQTTLARGPPWEEMGSTVGASVQTPWALQRG